MCPRSNYRSPVLVLYNEMVAVSRLALVLALAVAACTQGAGPATTSAPTTVTTPTASTTTEVTATSLAPTTVAPTTSTTAAATPESTPYAAVAWERGGRLAVLGVDPEPELCTGEGEAPCGPLHLVGHVEVAPGPHNTAAFGGVVLATHPQEGTLSRYDAATGEVLVASVGAEPHDVDFSPDGSSAYVTDESGGRLFILDPATLEPTQEITLPADRTTWPSGTGRSG